MWKIAKYALLGAILAVSASGSFGFDDIAPDFIVAALGGSAGAAMAKAMLLL